VPYRAEASKSIRLALDGHADFNFACRKVRGIPSDEPLSP
jgi:hypothetical protein